MDGITSFVSRIVDTVNTFLWDYALLFLLVGAGIFFTLMLRFIQVRKFGAGMKSLFGKLFPSRKGHRKRPQFFPRALTTAVAAQVGTGNIAGAATAIAAGGPRRHLLDVGQRFLRHGHHLRGGGHGQKTRVVEDGTVTGGPIYYIKYAFKGRFGKFLAGFFSVAVILALGFMGNMVQSNSIGESFSNVFGVNPLIVGIIVGIVAGFIFLGGIKRIARFTEKIVPLMALLYIVGCIVVLAMTGSGVGRAFHDIFVGAFDPQAIAGGMLGVTVQKAMRYGVARGLFSNEAGMGSHAPRPCHRGCEASLGSGYHRHDGRVHRYLCDPDADRAGYCFHRRVE